MTYNAASPVNPTAASSKKELIWQPVCHKGREDTRQNYCMGLVDYISGRQRFSYR